jgi:hypothetical protein
MLTAKDTDQIVAWARKGAKVLIGRDHTGRHKIKIRHGLFGLKTTRLQCEPQDVEQLRKRLSEVGIV